LILTGLCWLSVAVLPAKRANPLRGAHAWRLEEVGRLMHG
jgi:hypothetical protein